MTVIEDAVGRLGTLWAICALVAGVCLAPMVGLALGTEVAVVPIVVSGAVVDSAGKPLRSVDMTVIERRNLETTFETVSMRRRSTIDGAFEVRCSDCSDISLRFEAQGYFPKDVGFKLTSEEFEALGSGNPPAGFTIVRRGVLVQMEPAGNVVVLDRVDLTLDLNREGPQRVLVREDDRPTLGTYREVVLKRQGSLASDGTAMVALAADSGHFDGLIRVIGGHDHDQKLQLSAVLEFSGADSGAVWAEVNGQGPEATFHELSEAPVSGYSASLPIDPNQPGDQYFYCRIGGRYGKGRISPLRIGWDRDSNETLEVGLVVYLNRDGGRNLNALEY